MIEIKKRMSGSCRVQILAAALLASEKTIGEERRLGQWGKGDDFISRSPGQALCCLRQVNSLGCRLMSVLRHGLQDPTPCSDAANAFELLVEDVFLRMVLHLPALRHSHWLGISQDARSRIPACWPQLLDLGLHRFCSVHWNLGVGIRRGQCPVKDNRE